jgi:hypothetical protein
LKAGQHFSMSRFFGNIVMNVFIGSHFNEIIINKSFAMIKNLLCLFIILISSQLTINAQSPNYAFLATSGTYTPISGGTNVILTYNGVTNNDDGIATPANAVPIGFTFFYNGTPYTTIRPCANGFATFSSTPMPNNTDTWTNSLTSGVGSIRPIISPLWDDLDMGSGSVTYLLSGSAPARVLTIQWANALWEYNAPSPVISFQVKLYETTNVIEFIYRQESGPITSAGDLGASIGITTTATGNNTFLSLSDASSNPFVSSSVEVTTIATKPATGQIYRWSPYCTAGGTSAVDEKITNVTFNTINNNSSATSPYVNFTNISTIIQPATSYPISVTVSPFYNTDQAVVFIDFNHNGLFTDPGETVFISNVPASSSVITGMINIPALSANVLAGPTRMRVRLHNTGNGTANPTSCGNSTYGQVQDYTVDIELCNSATINTQPANTFICNGGNGSISISASGSGLTYQWQASTNGGTSFSNISNGALYSGVTTSTLNITGATPGMNGYQYRVLLNGICTPANTPSNAATITINTPAAINSQPVNVKACKGDTVSFAVTATGSLPTYQWQVSVDGGITYSDLSGATAPILKLPNVGTNSNGNRYRCVVTVPSCGSVISSGAILTVNALPVVTISSDPYSQIRPALTTYITAGSVPSAVSYIWIYNGSIIQSANNNFILADVNGIGTYKATVTDINGCVNSSPDLQITSLASNKLFIYPNPSNGQFQVRYYSNPQWIHQRTVTIYNSAGARVLQKVFVINSAYFKMDFDLRNFPPGMYTIHIPGFYAERETIASFIIVK